VALVILAALGPGLPRAARAVPAEPATRGKAGVVFVVGGVGGIDFLGLAAHWALPRAGVQHEIRDFVWTHPGRNRYFRDLQDVRYLVGKAEELAAEVRRYKGEHPDRPVYLVGKSGGAGVVLAAAECLPAATLDRIILLSPAVSPTYDLRPALTATKGEIISFYSIYDQFILGWGTRQFGTVDRFYCPAAGLYGFVVPGRLGEADRALYQRLVQLPWRPAMIFEGNLGNHTGSSMPGFVGREVGPWLKP
jgi:hypothetical protein